MFGTTHRGRARGHAGRGVVAVPAALLLLSLAACSSSTESDDVATANGSAADPAAVAAAEERLAPLLIPVEETTIEVDEPLTQAPETGLEVSVIRYNNPAAAVYDQGMLDAGEALGWDVNITPVDATDPQAIPNSMIRAVSEEVDFIVVISSSIQATGPGMDAAKEAGIPVMFGAGLDEPEGEANGLYGNTLGATTQNAVLAAIDKMIVDSGGSGAGLLVNAPDFPLLAPIDDAAVQHVEENCSQCSLDLLGISAADLGGDVASNIVATVRQNPDIKYVVTTFTSLSAGLAPALKAAGLDDVQVYLSGATEADVELIRDGTYPVGVLYPVNNYPWLLFDQIARVSLGMDPLQDQHTNVGLQMWTTETVPAGAVNWDPPGFEEKYKELWQVS